MDELKKMSKLKKSIGSTKSNQSKEKEKLYKQVASSKAGKKTGVKIFYEETQSEIKKVKWPHYSLVVRASIFVIGIVVFTTLYVTLLDLGFSKFFFEYIKQI